LKQQGQAILVIDKNIDDLKRIADRHYIVEKGQVVWSGSTAELDENAALVQEKLGV
jgi:branched-chain amino acid transport system ATP-binding protein